MIVNDFYLLCPVQFPGWIVNSEGSVFITTANDNAVGMYTCTAYNSYGTMGRSEPTQVILKVRLVTQLFPLNTQSYMDTSKKSPSFPLPGPTIIPNASSA